MFMKYVEYKTNEKLSENSKITQQAHLLWIMLNTTMLVSWALIILSVDGNLNMITRWTLAETVEHNHVDLDVFWGASL